MKTVGSNRFVVESWYAGNPARSYNGNFRTDGLNLYSYRMKIGRTLEGNVKQVLNVRGDDSYSVTTTAHVAAALYVPYRAGFGRPELVQPVSTRNEHDWYSGWRWFPDEAPLELQPKIELREYKGAFDIVGDIIRYEEGTLDEDGTIILFQRLVDTGLVWRLQGHYGRTAERLINAGLVFVDRPYETVGRDPELH